MEHADIRFDEDYARFYEAYSGQRKLPPPVEGRTLYSELGLLQQKQQMLAHQQGMLSSATPPPSQAALLMNALTPGGEVSLLCCCSLQLEEVQKGKGYIEWVSCVQDSRLSKSKAPITGWCRHFSIWVSRTCTTVLPRVEGHFLPALSRMHANHAVYGHLDPGS